MNAVQRRFSSIFVVIDPTRFVQTAFLRAEAIAKSNGAKLTAYCCLATDTGDQPDERLDERLRLTRESIERISTLPAGQVEIQVEASSDWRKSLVDAASSSSTDLVIKVVSRHSRVGRVFNATADWMLLSKAKQPVLLVADREPHSPPRRLLAAIKLKPDDKAHETLNDQIIDLAHYLSEAVGFELHVATAFRGDDVYFDRQKFADSCRLPRNRVHAVQGIAHTAIASAAADVGADTIVIGNTQKSETAQRLIDQADADVMILPP
jgi:nucleotide-binding universal stress UspA family protein